MGTRSSSPCAACRFIRRKCLPECVFAPYFPADEPRKFEIVHKVYGAGNVAKMLSELRHEERGETVKSLVYEAEARLKDPVHGCVGLVAILQDTHKKIKADLMDALNELSILEAGAQPDANANANANVPILRPHVVPDPAPALSEFQYVAAGFPMQTLAQQFPPLMMDAHRLFTEPLMIDPHEQFFMQSLQPQIVSQSPQMVDPQQYLMQSREPLMNDPQQQSSTRQLSMQQSVPPLTVDPQQFMMQVSQPSMVASHQPPSQMDQNHQIVGPH